MGSRRGGTPEAEDLEQGVEAQVVEVVRGEPPVFRSTSTLPARSPSARPSVRSTLPRSSMRPSSRSARSVLSVTGRQRAFSGRPALEELGDPVGGLRPQLGPLASPSMPGASRRGSGRRLGAGGRAPSTSSAGGASPRGASDSSMALWATDAAGRGHRPPWEPCASSARRCTSQPWTWARVCLLTLSGARRRCRVAEQRGRPRRRRSSSSARSSWRSAGSNDGSPPAALPSCASSRAAPRCRGLRCKGARVAEVMAGKVRRGCDGGGTPAHCHRAGG